MIHHSISLKQSEPKHQYAYQFSYPDIKLLPLLKQDYKHVSMVTDYSIPVRLIPSFFIALILIKQERK